MTLLTGNQMTNLTIEQFVDQMDIENLNYALPATIITGSGVVCEEDEKVLCSGEQIYNFMFNDDSFNGQFTVENVTEYIQAMNDMA